MSPTQISTSRYDSKIYRNQRNTFIPHYLDYTWNRVIFSIKFPTICNTYRRRGALGEKWNFLIAGKKSEERDSYDDF